MWSHLAEEDLVAKTLKSTTFKTMKNIGIKKKIPEVVSLSVALASPLPVMSSTSPPSPSSVVPSASSASTSSVVPSAWDCSSDNNSSGLRSSSSHSSRKEERNMSASEDVSYTRSFGENSSNPTNGLSSPSSVSHPEVREETKSSHEKGDSSSRTSSAVRRKEDTGYVKGPKNIPKPVSRGEGVDSMEVADDDEDAADGTIVRKNGGEGEATECEVDLEPEPTESEEEEAINELNAYEEELSCRDDTPPEEIEVSGFLAERGGGGEDEDEDSDSPKVVGFKNNGFVFNVEEIENWASSGTRRKRVRK